MPRLRPEERGAFETVLRKVRHGESKTHILKFCRSRLNILLTGLKKLGHVSVAAGSSVFAATLLEVGRTVHSILKLPLNTGREEN